MEIDPGTPSRGFATSFFDGRVDTGAVFKVSLDGANAPGRPHGGAPTQANASTQVSDSWNIVPYTPNNTPCASSPVITRMA